MSNFEWIVTGALVIIILLLAQIRAAIEESNKELAEANRHLQAMERA